MVLVYFIMCFRVSLWFIMCFMVCLLTVLWCLFHGARYDKVCVAFYYQFYGTLYGAPYVMCLDVLIVCLIYFYVCLTVCFVV